MTTDTKTCVTCKQTKAVAEFNKNSSAPDGLRNTCKACRAIQFKTIRDANREEYNKKGKENYHARKADNPRRLWAVNCITNHKARGMTVNISKDELEQLAKSTDTCAYCGETVEYDGGVRANPKAASLDRIGNELTLTKDNVCISCMDCNRMKAEKSVEDFEAKMMKVLAHRGYKVVKC